MADVLTTKLKNNTARAFYQDVQDNDYYVFVSAISQSELIRVDAVNSQYSKNQFLENTVFGKKVFNSDVRFMIKYYPWQKDAVYVQYDDKINLEDQKFYAVVGPTNNDSGDYRVYKCLFNNHDAKSEVPPNYNPVTVNQIYRTADGYVWKYMYALTVQEFEAYNAVGYIPIGGVQSPFEIDPEANTAYDFTGSEISDIFVENYIDNAGYPNVSYGILVAAPTNDFRLKISSAQLSPITNYYSGMVIYINNTTGDSYVYEIDTYNYDASTNTGTVKVIGDPKGDGINNTSIFQILPRIVISGDGTGCVAVPRLIDGRINSMIILDGGSGYNNVTAEVIDPPFDFDPDDPNTIDVRAVLRPVLSPKGGGHGVNLIDELHCRNVLLYGYITETDNNLIGATNTYSALGIVRNPEFKASANTTPPDVFDNRIAIITDNFSKAVVDTQLYQTTSLNVEVFRAKVHEVDDTANTVYLSNYMGPYLNQANSDISLNPSLDLINSTGQLIQINTPVANNVIESQYIQRTGTIYYMEDFFPLTRSETSREEYKLVLEF